MATNRLPPIVAIPLVLAALPAAHMVASVVYGTVMRYEFHTPSNYDDLVNLDLVWTVLLACGAALAWRHAPTAALLSGEPLRPWQRILGGIVALASALCFAGMAVLAGLQLNEAIATAEATPDGLPKWLFRLAAVVGLALAALVLVGVAIAYFRPAPAAEPGDAA